jgi:hypothetical protein
MLSRIYIQCFENNRGAEQVEVNYERFENPKKKLRRNYFSFLLQLFKGQARSISTNNCKKKAHPNIQTKWGHSTSIERVIDQKNSRLSAPLSL